MDNLKVTIDEEAFERLKNKYSKELVDKAARVVDKYARKVSRDAKRIVLREAKDTGALHDKIEPSLKESAGKITGEVNAGAKYARFVHEGAEHKGDSGVYKHFVPFKAAKSLLQWLHRHNIIYKKTKTGKRKRRSSNVLAGGGSGYYFKSKRTGREYPVDTANGGWWVTARPTKFFEKPFNEVKGDFVQEMNRLIGGKR